MTTLWKVPVTVYFKDSSTETICLVEPERTDLTMEEQISAMVGIKYPGTIYADPHWTPEQKKF